MRAFIAIDVPEEVREKAYSVARRIAEETGARAADRDSMHITLHFLGNIDDAQRSKVEYAMDALHAERFGVEVKGVGFFGGKEPRVAIASIGEGSSEIIGIYKKLYQPVSDAGITLERREFTPHLTLARMKNERHEIIGTAKISSTLQELAEEYKDFAFGSFLCDRIMLKKSEFAKGGVVHTTLHEKIFTSQP